MRGLPAATKYIDSLESCRDIDERSCRDSDERSCRDIDEHSCSINRPFWTVPATGHSNRLTLLTPPELTTLKDIKYVRGQSQDICQLQSKSTTQCEKCL